MIRAQQAPGLWIKIEQVRQLKVTESKATVPPGHLLPLSHTLSKLQCACHAPIDTKHTNTSKITKTHFWN